MPAVDDQSAHAPPLERGGEQLAEHAVGGGRGGGDDQEVALAALLDGGVNHEVVTRPGQHGDGGARDADALLDGAQTGPEQAGTAHGLVHGRGAVSGDRLDVLRVRLRRAGDDHAAHASSLAICG